MVTIVLYLIANMFLSLYVERRHRFSAMVAHAILFAFTFSLLLFCTDVPFCKGLMQYILGSQYDDYMAAYNVGGVSVMAPFAVVEIVIILQMLITAAVFAAEVVTDLFVRAHKKYDLLDKDDCADECSTLPYTNRKLYYEYSVLRC